MTSPCNWINLVGHTELDREQLAWTFLERLFWFGFSHTLCMFMHRTGGEVVRPGKETSSWSMTIMSNRERQSAFSQLGEVSKSTADSCYGKKQYRLSKGTGDCACIDVVKLPSWSRLPGEATRPENCTCTNVTSSFFSKQHVKAFWQGRGKWLPSLQRAALFRHIA